MSIFLIRSSNWFEKSYICVYLFKKIIPMFKFMSIFIYLGDAIESYITIFLYCVCGNDQSAAVIQVGIYVFTRLLVIKLRQAN